MRQNFQTKVYIIFIGFIFLFGCKIQREQFRLTEQNYEMWRDYIKPTENDLLWTNISWRNSFQDGLAEARAQQKPMLLWVMNGHPLGCT